MSAISVVKKYQKLDSAQKAFLRAKKQGFDQDISSLIAFLEPTTQFDEDLDKTNSQFKQIQWIVFAVIFLGFIAFFLLNLDSRSIPGLLFIVGGIAGLAIFIAVTVCRIILSRVNLRNALRETVLPLLTVIQQDADADRNVQLFVDMGGSLRKQKLKETNDDIDDRGRKVETNVYEDNWFNLQSEFIDGTRLHLSIMDRVTEKTIRYRSSSGKSKSKTKCKGRHCIEASLAIRNTDVALPDTFDGLKSKQGEKRTVLSNKRVIEFEGPDDSPLPIECVQVIGRIFAGAKSAVAQGEN